MIKNTNNLPTGSAPRTLILGAGVAGLAAAIRLAADGASVCIVEQLNHLCGKLRQCVVPHPEFQNQLFRFDTGPTHLTLPYAFMDLFAAAGEDVRQQLPIQQIDPIARYVWPDGTRFDLHAGEKLLGDELKRLWPKDVDGFFRLLDDGRHAWERIEPQIGRPPEGAGAMQSMRRLVSFVRTGTGSSFSRLLHRRIASPRLREAITHFVGGNIDSSFEPADRAALLWIAHYYGAWHVTGGMYRLGEQLERLARKLGVQFDTSRSADPARLDAELIVVDDEGQHSSPALLLGVDGHYPQLAHRNIYFAEDDQPTIEIDAPTRTDPSIAPAGCELLIVRASLPQEQSVNALETICGLTELRRRTVVQRRFEAERFTQSFHQPNTPSIVIPNADLFRQDPGLLALWGLRLSLRPPRRHT